MIVPIKAAVAGASIGALLACGCAASAGRNAQDPRRPPATPADACHADATAKWARGVVTLDLTPTAGPILLSDTAVVSGGTLLAVFGEAGVPTLFVQPDPGVAHLNVRVPMQCAVRPGALDLHLDLSAGPSEGAPIPLVMEPPSAN